ncbi:MAG TPA: hypothetical protein VKE22_27045 [Haliangiales bacterium]|nr:hypothetical protein [Haliangiales bacterium]
MAGEAAVGASRGPIDQGTSRRVLGGILSLVGDHRGAERELDAAWSLLHDADVGEAARVVAEQARAALRRGDAARAASLVAQARSRLEALGAALDLRELENLGWI